MIVCEICDYKTENSLQPHLNHKHELINKQYLEIYPNAKIYSQVYCDRLKYTNAHRDPSYKKKLSENTKRLYRDSDWVKNHNKALTLANYTKKVKENRREGARKYFDNRTKEQERLHRESIIKSWKDPQKRANRIKALKEAHNRSEVREKHSLAMKKFISTLTSEEKQKRRQNLKEVWAIPENRKKILKLAEKGLKVAVSPKGRVNFYKAQKNSELREKRSKVALKRMVNQPVISSLNIRFYKKLNEIELYPLQEYPINHYLVDFCFLKERIIIEVDGDYWHGNPSIYSYDELNIVQQKTVNKDRREATYCKNHGWILLRFWEKDINENISTCIKKVKEVLYESRR